MKNVPVVEQAAMLVRAVSKPPLTESALVTGGFDTPSDFDTLVSLATQSSGYSTTDT
jgi:hypothetical protein